MAISGKPRPGARREGAGRRTISSITVPTTVHAQRVYPVHSTQATQAMVLDREQAIHLARLLLVAVQEWDAVHITTFRKPLANGSYSVVVSDPSSPGAAAEEPDHG